MKYFRLLIKHIGDTVRIDSLRKLFVIELIIILILIQGIHVLRPVPKIWPFSNYPMFSYSSDLVTNVVWMRLTGITIDGGEITLPFSYCFLPLDRISFANSIIYNFGDSEEQRKSLDILMKELFTIYRENRKDGIYDCPDIIGLRVYKLEWDWTDVPAESSIHTDEPIYSLIGEESTHY